MDCMEFMRGLPDGFFDLVIADPPYGIGAENHAGKKNNGWTQWDKKEWDSKTPSKSFFSELERVSKNQIIWGGNYFELKPSQGWILWDKGQRDFSLADGELAWTSFDRALRVFDFSRAKALSDGKIHPTQKPVAIYKWLLTNYAKPGHKIFDPMMGSQSSRIAAWDMGFDYYGCELDADYYRDGEARFKAHTAKPVLFAPEQMYNFEQVNLF